MAATNSEEHRREIYEVITYLSQNTAKCKMEIHLPYDSVVPPSYVMTIQKQNVMVNSPVPQGFEQQVELHQGIGDLEGIIHAS